MAINDPRFRYAQQLVQSGTDTSPVQHWTQGASRLAQALLGAQMQNRIEQENQQAQQAMVQGFGAQPWVNPDTGQVAPNQKPTGGIEGALAALGRQNNPAASRLASQLMNLQMDQMLQNQQFDRRRQARLEDYRTQKTIDQEFAPEPDRFETVQNPYGRGGVAQRNVKTGQIVNYQGPAEGPKPQFMNIDGQIVAINPNDMTATSLGQFGQPKTTAREDQINRLIETGIDRNTAVAIADGRYTTSRDPISGQVQIVDKATGMPVGVQPEPTGSADLVPGMDRSTLPSDVDYSAATGGTGFAGNLANTVAGAFGGQYDPEVERAGQGLKNLQVRTQTGLQAAVPGRPSNYLMEQIGALTVSPYSITQGDARARERLSQTRDMIQQELQRMERDILSQPQNFRPSEVSETRLNASQLRGLLADYDTALKSFTGGQQESTDSVDEELLQYMTPEERALFEGGQ